MDGIIQVKVKGSYLSKDSDRGGVRGEANVTLMRIEFSEDWMEIEDKRITFLNALGRNPTEIKLTDELLEEGVDSTYLCFIPGEAYTHDGWFSFVIDGYAEGVRKRSVEGKLECVYAPSIDGEHLPADYELAEIKVMSGTRDVVHLPKKGVYFDKVIALGDEDLIPENIKAGVVILGVEGSFEGEKGLLSEIIVRSGPADFIEIPATGFYGIGKVTVEGDPDLVPQNIKAGVTILDVEGTYVPEELKLVAKSLTITQNGEYTVTPGNGNAGMNKVTVTADVPQTVEKVDADLRELHVTPGSDTQTFDKRNAEDFNGYNYVRVSGDSDLIPDNIRGGVTIFGVEGIYEKRELQSKSVMPGKTDKTVKADSDYDGLSIVKVYGDSDLIPQNIRKGATIFNVEGTYDTGQNFQDKEVTPGRQSILAQPDTSYDALSSVLVHGDRNLIPENIADGVTIFNTTGTYISPMKEITVVPSRDEQTIIPVPSSGYYGFDKIYVLSSETTGEYNDGYRDAQEEAAEQIAGLEEEISQLTQDKNAAYGEGYEEGYDDGYADGAASGGGGGGGETKATHHLYGTPNSEGNVILQTFVGDIRCNGAVLPKLPEWDKETYPYAYMKFSGYFTVISKKKVTLIISATPVAFGGSLFAWGAYGETTFNFDENTEWSSFTYRDKGSTSINESKFFWGNTEIVNASDNSVYLAKSAPIPLASAEPVAAVYNGVKLPVLPEWDKNKYPYAVINGTLLGTILCTLYVCENAITYTKPNLRPNGGNYLKTKYYLGDDFRWSYDDDGAVFSEELTFDNNTLVNYIKWANYDILNTADGTVRIAASDPIPVYEQKE